MGKIIFRFIISLILILVLLITYLSYFGIETDRFDSLIKGKANEVNRLVRLEFQNTKIHLNLKEMNLVVKLQAPKILIKDHKINLSKLDLYLPVKSFITSDFLLKRAEIAFARNNIKDLTKVTSAFLPRIINKQLNKIFVKGNLEGEFIIPFESDGTIGQDYGFAGKISESKINLTKEFSIKNLTTEIKHKKEIEGNKFEITINQGNIYDLQLAKSIINIKRKKKETFIDSSIKTTGKVNFDQVKKITKLFNLNLNNIKDINGEINLETLINVNLDKKIKVKNFSYSINGVFPSMQIDTIEKKIIKKYLPDYDSKIILKDTNFNFISDNSKHTTKANGFVKMNNKFDSFKIEETYNYNKKNLNLSGIIDLTNSKVKLSRLNYKKDNNKPSEVSFDLNFKPNKYYNIKRLNFLADKTNIDLLNVKLNRRFEVVDLKKIKVKTFLANIKNNDFLVEKLKEIVVSGEVFDAHSLLKSLYKKGDKKIFSNDFNSKIKVNFKKTLTGTDDDVSNFAMIASINKGSYNKLSLKGNFSKNEIIEMSIYQIDNNKKTLQVISDRARPFIKNFNFVKGFEEGKLEYESTITKEGSNSNLLITDFKVSKVPALAQLLTLASLQGIADTLSGEGIRFDSFEMKTNSKDNILNIEDALAMGPAVSILLNGYIDKGKIVSLRGTLVPATKLNSIIASIPVVGDILVGKKTGEGVVGVSFKMKGPPKDIKTTVNPIKTLTPRFIVRAVEKMKKKKKEEAK